MANARFWVWHNGGWTKITLAPGQALKTYTGGQTDEGWYREITRYEHDGDGVLAKYVEESCDCDGRLDRHGAMYCPLHQLRDRDMYEIGSCSEDDGILAPAWQRLDRWQRDHAAEACGY